MAVILIDTDVFSFLWQARPEAERYGPHVEGQVVSLSFTSVAEAYFGAFKKGWGGPRMDSLVAALQPYLVLPYDREMSVIWARLRAACEANGTPVGINDLWIAATAVHHGVPLLTNNRRHFEVIEELQPLLVDA